MHCVLLGVVKMLLNLWFDKLHRNSIFIISSKIQEVDQRLLNIKPPSFITRLPRSLTDVSHYKAAEFKNFLLYYGLPCLYGILPAEQYHHFSLLVFSTYILLQEKISATNILHCRQMCWTFLFFMENDTQHPIHIFYSIWQTKWWTLDHYGPAHASILKTLMDSFDIFSMALSISKHRLRLLLVSIKVFTSWPSL